MVVCTENLHKVELLGEKGEEGWWWFMNKAVLHTLAHCKTFVTLCLSTAVPGKTAGAAA